MVTIRIIYDNGQDGLSEGIRLHARAFRSEWSWYSFLFPTGFLRFDETSGEIEFEFRGDIWI